MNTIHIREYESFDLPHSEAGKFHDLLKHIWRDRRLNPTYSTLTELTESDGEQGLFAVAYQPNTGLTRFKAGKYIGIYQTEFTQVFVNPKIFPSEDPLVYQKLLTMLQYAHGLKIPVSPDVDLGDTRITYDYEELLIYLFSKITYATLKDKTYLFYQSVQENTGFVRGKILFTQNLKENLVRMRQEKVYCEFDLFQEDNLFNRILKFVVKSLLVRTRHVDTKRTLMQILDMLGNVADTKCTARDCDRITFNNWQREFQPILQYCRLFLGQSRPFWQKDKLTLDYFILDMNDLFEKYVAGFLKQQLSKEWNVIPSYSTTYLTHDRQFQLRYDVLLRNKITGQKIIVDTKYKTGIYLEKKGSDSGISSADLYQMVTYAVREGCENVVLVYPLLEDEVYREKQIHVDPQIADVPLTISAAKVAIGEVNYLLDCIDKLNWSQLSPDMDAGSERQVS